MSDSLIKKHSESITHNTIGGVVSHVIIQGVPGMMGFMAALLAQMRGGFPWHWAILVGAAVFCLFSIAWYFLTRRRAIANAVLPAALPAADDAEQRIAAMQSQHQSETDSLRREHTLEIRGYVRGYDVLKREYETAKERLKGWEEYTWLVGIAETQARDISRYVELERIERGDVHLNEAIPKVIFGIYITNHSVYTVNVELEPGGHLTFRGEEFLYPVKVIHNGLRGVPYRGGGAITVEQRLTKEEAHLIGSSTSRDDAFFHFDKLVFNITGDGRQPPLVEPARLTKIKEGVELHNEHLIARS